MWMFILIAGYDQQKKPSESDGFVENIGVEPMTSTLPA